MSNSCVTSESCRVWTRFESKREDGSTLKLRIQTWLLQPQDDVFEFLIKHFVPEEAIHKAAGIAKSEEALKEYREFLSIFFKVAPLHATVCCVDNDSNTAERILGVAVAQLMKNTDKLEDMLTAYDVQFKTKEMQQLLHAAKVLESHLENMTANYEHFYYGRGIIVHPEYRKLGIANELIKVKTLICAENNVLMTCARMSATGTQKAAEKNGWNIFSEAPIEELEKMTGLTFEKNTISSYKLMYTTIHLNKLCVKNEVSYLPEH